MSRDLAAEARVRQAEPVMGTVVSFDVPAAARRDGSLDAAIRWLHWVDRVFSPYRPDSDATLLADGLVTVDACAPEMAEVIEACAFFRELSGGFFTASPWGRFDPSGYVKGWAIERAAGILTAAGSASHLVNGGGDVQCVGARLPAAPVAGRAGGGAGGGAGATGVSSTEVSSTGPDTPAQPWRIGIADPFRPGRLALVVTAVDCAVATSGTAERGAHIVNPRTGSPAAGLASLTVTSRSLALADACATAAFAMGPALARDWLASLDGVQAYAITAAGETWHTAGFAAFIDRG